MKNKNVAAILAFFGGFVGLHRFYLGQVGLGVVYALLFVTGISVILGILDGIIFLTMDQHVFDAKYNRRYGFEARRDTDFQRPGRRATSYERYQSQRAPQRKPRAKRPVRRPSSRVRNNPFKLAGIKKFKEFDIEAAIEDFKQALKIDPNDLTIHFNLACAYSQTEQAEKAFEHISRAVEMGFNDFGKIDSHDALAYMRIQPQWEEFKTNGYTLRKQLAAPKENLLDNDLLLEQLKKLNELKEKGLITEKEFIEQKSKLTRQ
ncbi:MAG: NINE protein [Saprospiraceae bacterium]|nr:NINE protein [Saprospiraceae bacterium]